MSTLDIATKEHCYHCFDTIAEHIACNGDGNAPDPKFPNGTYPLFVTWKKKNLETGEMDLRGCIGCFDPLDLHYGLSKYAVTSAFADTRFEPIQKKELKLLKCGVSLLHSFEDGKDYLDWEIGKHGIRIEFIDTYGKKRSSTYLPDVMLETGWTKEQTIRSLLRKGGFQGHISDKVTRGIQLQRYQSSKAEATYTEYLEHKQQRDS
ncbi:hypothetical protein BGZ94_005236 [Podila epigama]|nr:hypothetical protein BGZ94_005236 [Podila epigama]